MLSIIICSLDAKLLRQVSKNIAETVDIPYELLFADNKEAKDGICKVYNRLAAQAQYPYLCFVHEDVLLHTNCWGRELIEALAHQYVGLVGVSGATYKSKYPASWSACNKELYRFSGIQHFKQTSKSSHSAYNPLNEKLSEVAVIDGVLMAIKKEVWNRFPFNELELTGFHCYDIDLSIRIKKAGYTILVMQAVRLEHLSEGNLNENWLKDSLKFHNKEMNFLPLEIGSINTELKRVSDYQSLVAVLTILIDFKGNKVRVVRYYLTLMIKYFSYNRLTFSRQVVKYLMGLAR